ncbi:MAG: diaminopimelate epimerase [Lewinellaceae bacterium]|nr:diaminopimelate epimerase [Lewinellaceae bacterium]
MNAIPFVKYQGAGNDFVILDQRQTTWVDPQDIATIARLCDRRFGIGADGLMMLEDAAGYDFRMRYFNADGREGSMCGNGGRCIAAFAQRLGIIQESGTFIAVDGPHQVRLPEADWVELHMIDVNRVEQGPDYFYMNTGSPHYVVFVEDLSDLNIVEAGRQIRYSDRFRAEGTNVNFVEESPEGGLIVATYERGVEDETLACGTGVTASALAYYLRKKWPVDALEVPIEAKGGQLSVHFRAQPGAIAFSDIWLCGPAQWVFSGTTNPN